MSSAFNASAPSPAIEGDQIPEIQSKILGFKTLNGDKKARVLKEPWPQDALPPPYASLLSIAPAHGLYAAAGADALFIGTTDKVRNCIYPKGGDDVRDCDPLQTIPHSRLAHVAFAADESCLIVAEEASSEIIAYQTSVLAAGRSDVALRLSTNAPIRVIVPNPDPRQAHLFALLNTNGQLLLADLAKAEFVVLAEGVSCVAYSTKGKQLMAGKADGTAVQLKPEDRSVQAVVGKPTSVPANCHLAHISWIETNVYLFIYTPSVAMDDISQQVIESYIVKTNKDRSKFTFHKTEYDLVFPSVNRAPAYFHVSRLREYAPHLDQLLVVTASVSSEIKMITKASKPLSDDLNEENAYAITIPGEDDRVACTPIMQDGSTDTTAIGMVFDFSDKDPILQPMFGDGEDETSHVPLPELAVLNNEGLLSMWSLVYDDGVKSKTPYHAFTEVARIREGLGSSPEDDMEPVPTLPEQPAPPDVKPLSSPPLMKTPTSPFAQIHRNPTATSSNQQGSVFGQPTAFGSGTGFSKPTPIGGATSSSWTTSGFGQRSQQQGSAFSQQPSFGSTPTLGSTDKPTFGQTGSLGGLVQQSGAMPSFGQTGFGTQIGHSSISGTTPTSTSSPFAGKNTNVSGGFGSFATQNGFGAAKKDSGTGNTFSKFSGSGIGNAQNSSPFAKTPSNAQSIFGQDDGQTAFGKSTPFGGTQPVSSPFGRTSNTKFKLDSTFQKDDRSKNESDDDGDSGATFGFSSLGSTLRPNKVPTLHSPSKEEDMDDDNGSDTEVENASRPQATPPTTITQPKATTTPHISSLFGPPMTTTPQSQPAGTGFSFGFPSTTPKETPAQTTIFGTKPVSEDTPAAVQKSEPNKPFSFQQSPTQRSDSDRVRSLSDSDEERGEGEGDEEEADEDEGDKEEEDDEEEDGEEEEEIEAEDVPEAPLPPDPFSAPGHQAGETATSPIKSKDSKDGPVLRDFVPANKTAPQSIGTQESEIQSEVLSDGFEEGSGEDVTGDVSPVEGGQSEESESAEPIDSSPESSFNHVSNGPKSNSPPGGVFTNLPKGHTKPKPLFGEVPSSGPIFPPPQPKQPQGSPRSPSPLRKGSRPDMLSRSPARSSSAPVRGKSNIEERKKEYQQSPFAASAVKARVEQEAADRSRHEAERQASEAQRAAEQQALADDEDEKIREELHAPIEPDSELGPFIPAQAAKAFEELDQNKTDIPSQIERLYHDINSMVVTLGINARSLSSYMMYHRGQPSSAQWPQVLASDSPTDVLSEKLRFQDIDRLSEGRQVLETGISGMEVKDVMQKLEDCQHLLTKEVTDLRSRITILRRNTQARARVESIAHAPLSAEQISVQQDLRRSVISVRTTLKDVENNLVLLKARISDLAPVTSSERNTTHGLGSNAQKKPSVEAVMSTVRKMTMMAEKKSADVDVLEAQLKKLGVTTLIEAPSTPERQVARTLPTTPGSGASTVFHTPDSRGGRSVHGTPSRSKHLVLSAEDRERYQAKAQKKAAVANTLRDVLQARQARKA